MTKKSKFLGFGCIFAGFFFFCNPYLAAMDLLPDFVGCFLICLGLTPLSRISAPLNEARKAFLYFAFADAAKNILLMAVFGISSPTDRSTMLLTLAFAGTVLGLAFMIPAIRSFFDGMEYLALYEECPYLYERKTAFIRHFCVAPVGTTPRISFAKREISRPSRNERMKSFSIIFLIFREVLCLLPEFAALLNASYVDSNFTFLYDYIGLMRFLACLPVAILGLIWLGRLIAYFVGIKRQSAFRARLIDRYSAFVTDHPGTRVKMWQGIAFFCLTIGAVLTADFYIDFKNIFPDIFAGLLLTVGVLCLQTEWYLRFWGALSGVAFSLASFFSSDLAYLFIMNHTAGSISKDQAAADAYFAMWGSALAEMIIFSACLLFIMLALRRVLHLHGGYRPEHTEKGEFESRSILRLREEFDKRFILCYLFGFISAIMSFLYDYIKEWPNEMRIYRLLEFLWIPDLLTAVFFAIYFAYLLSLIYKQIEAKYQFE